MKDPLPIRVAVIQADNRPFTAQWLAKPLKCPDDADRPDVMRTLNGGLGHELPFWSVTPLINALKCKRLGMRYERLLIEDRHIAGRWPTWGKISVLREYMAAHPDCDIVVFLDSDAWIRDHRLFGKVIAALHADASKHAAMSRDPKTPYNSFINTGCLCLKNTPYIRSFLERIWDGTQEQPKFLHEWPHEQGIASQIVQSEQDKFLVFGPHVLNSPCGEIVRHVWPKSMLDELLMDEMRACLTLAIMENEPPEAPFALQQYLDSDAT